MTLATMFDKLLCVRASDRDSTSLVRESYYKRDIPLPDLLGELREEHFTGQVTIDVSQGTIQGIRVRDELKIPT